MRLTSYPIVLVQEENTDIYYFRLGELCKV
jgi:hypothetical protein